MNYHEKGNLSKFLKTCQSSLKTWFPTKLHKSSSYWILFRLNALMQLCLLYWLSSCISNLSNFQRTVSLFLLKAASYISINVNFFAQFKGIKILKYIQNLYSSTTLCQKGLLNFLNWKDINRELSRFWINWQNPRKILMTYSNGLTKWEKPIGRSVTKWPYVNLIPSRGISLSTLVHC